jgi:hypothetical protein
MLKNLVPIFLRRTLPNFSYLHHSTHHGRDAIHLVRILLKDLHLVMADHQDLEAEFAARNARP